MLPRPENTPGITTAIMKGGLGREHHGPGLLEARCLPTSPPFRETPSHRDSSVVWGIIHRLSTVPLDIHTDTWTLGVRSPTHLGTIFLLSSHSPKPSWVLGELWGPSPQEAAQ